MADLRLVEWFEDPLRLLVHDSEIVGVFIARLRVTEPVTDLVLGRTLLHSGAAQSFRCQG